MPKNILHFERTSNKDHLMKNIIPILILLLSTVEGFSKCGPGRLYFWPSKPTVNPNSIFVIDGYGMSRKIVGELGTTYKVYLRSNKEKIKLNVQELLIGQFYQTQAVLKPETTLSAGKEYELVIENLDNLENQAYRFNDSTWKKEKIKWVVSNFNDTASPVWTSNPKFKNSRYDLYGCGPATFANFSFSATDNSEYLIKTTVKNKATAIETTYYLKPGNKEIAVGHGMCSGAFNFDDGDKFEVKFSLLDASGNLTTSTAEWIEFNRPTEKDRPRL